MENTYVAIAGFITIVCALAVWKAKTPAHRLPTDGKPVVNIFLSYSHDDMAVVDEFIPILIESLQKCERYDLKIWNDRKIKFGQKWHNEIQRAIRDCNFGLFLISPTFRRSDYILQHEWPHFFAEKGRDPKPAIPVVLVPDEVENPVVVVPDEVENQDQKFLRQIQARQKFLLQKKCFSQLDNELRLWFLDRLREAIEDRLDDWHLGKS